MRRLDYKDFWYVGIAATLTSFLTRGIFSSWILLLVGLGYFIASVVAYNKERELERQIYLLQKLRNIRGMLNIFQEILNDLPIQKPKETPKPKPNSRRSKRK